MGADPRGIFYHPLFHQRFHRRARYRTGEGIAAESRTMFARMEHAHHFAIRKHGRDRIKAAGERLSQKSQIGLDAVMFFGQKLSRAAKARLDLVQDEKDVVPAAKS